MISTGLRQGIEEAVSRLHSWRVGYNGDDVGFGEDELLLNCGGRHHFPHAYAVWGRGYAGLYRLYGDREHFNAALACAEWLLSNPNPESRYRSWGLPFAWKEGNEHISYAITTIYAGDLFWELYRITGEQQYADALRDIRAWIVEELGYRQDMDVTKGLWLNYANTVGPTFRRANYAVAGKSAGMFAKFCSVSGGNVAEDRYFAAGFARFIIGHQGVGGGWTYNDQGTRVDFLHSALVLDGLADFVRESGLLSCEAKRALSRGIRFYLTRMTKASGWAFENYPSSLVNFSAPVCTHKTLRELKQYFFSGAGGLETRSYGYGLMLKAMTKVWVLTDEMPMRGGALLTRLLDLQGADGGFGLVCRDDHRLVRVNAHIFDGFVSCLEAVNGKW